MRRLLKVILIAVGVVLLIPVAYLLLTFVGMLRQGVGRPITWEFAPGYRGWVVIRYEDPQCPPLSAMGIFFVITIPPSGRACTSSPMPQGWRYHRYEYVSPNGMRTVIPRGQEIWAESSVPVQQVVKFPHGIFFVGTKAELEKSWASEPDVREK